MAQAVSKPGLILNEACRGDQMIAHKASFFSGLYKAHSVRSDSIRPDYQSFETVWAVRPTQPIRIHRVLRRPEPCVPEISPNERAIELQDNGRRGAKRRPIAMGTLSYCEHLRLLSRRVAR